MRLTVATACDSAAIYNNSLSLLGTFDCIEADSFPVSKAYCSVAIQICWGKSEEGKHVIKVRFMNEDGQQTLNDSLSEVDVAMPKGCMFTTTTHLINLHHLKFNCPGHFQGVVSVDGKVIGEVPFQVVQREG